MRLNGVTMSLRFRASAWSDDGVEVVRVSGTDDRTEPASATTLSRVPIASESAVSSCRRYGDKTMAAV
jgi:hypothetical protein